MLERIVADVRRSVDEAPRAQIDFAGTECDAVDEIGVAVALAFERCEEARHVAESAMLELHVGLRGDGFALEPERVAERAVRVGESEEEVCVLVVRAASQHMPVPDQHIELEQRFVDESVPERRCLDAHACGGAAQRDRLELRHHRRQRAMSQRCGNQVFVRGHAFGLDPALTGVDRDDMIEPAQIEPPPGRAIGVAEQVRRVLAQPERLSHCAGFAELACKSIPARKVALFPLG